MAKRSREDFEPSLSPEASSSLQDDSSAPVSIRIINPSSSSKIQQLDHAQSGEADADAGADSEETTLHVPEMKCSLPPHAHTLSFPTFDEYEVHYAKEHTHRCLECRKNFPTGHFLNLHIEENHDSIVAVRRERGEKTYQCFVTDCDKVCSAPQKRRMHLIAKHGFPNEYDFYVVNDGIDRRSSMLRSGRHRRGSSAVQVEKARRRAGTLENGEVTGKEKTVEEKEEEDEDEEMDGDHNERSAKSEARTQHRKSVAHEDDEAMNDLVGGMSALKFIPPSIRFGRGRGKGRGGFSKT